ncbi:hypothetical protein HII31_05205 [Pseudocercospora fuligena]|uniref:F-box domain-containing protein n=1 Tax=Pseudocercospora fuligena TaxID=685502 RepID=A0A8H6RKD5_9PEZI|nr:hypothetical protein HII31_05205 [Pseudocercospora fuligena]
MASTNDSAAAESKRHIFPFFSLPRELRDAVYEDAALKVERVQECPNEGVALKTKALCPKLLRINKQFHTEYIEANKKNPDLASLILTDRVLDAGGRGFVKFPPWTATITTLKFNCAYACDHPHLFARKMVMTEIKLYIKDCTHQLPQNANVDIRLNIHDDHQEPFIRQQLEEKFTGIPHLRSLKVWDHGDPDEWVRVDATGVRRCNIDEEEPFWDPMLEWDKEKTMWM